MDDLSIKDVYIVGMVRHSFRRAIPAKIVGLKYVDPLNEGAYRLCYEVQYDDQRKDLIPLRSVEAEDYKLFTFDEIMDRKHLE